VTTGLGTAERVALRDARELVEPAAVVGQRSDVALLEFEVGSDVVHLAFAFGMFSVFRSPAVLLPS
jgi:hypothetical protein